MWPFWLEILLIWQVFTLTAVASTFSHFTNSSDLEISTTQTSTIKGKAKFGLPNEDLGRRAESATFSSERVIPTTITTYFDAYSADVTTLGTYYNTKSYWFGTTTSHYPILVDAITTHANISNVDKRNISSVLQCYSSLATWRNASASFMNAKIANRTWSVTSSWSYTATSWFGSSTIYPSNPSTYKLCDGTPRVNVRPETTYMSGTTTLWASFTSTLTPTFSPQPCTPSVPDCRILYVDTNAKGVYENMLLKYCGDPVHLEDQPQCIIGGGPVELIYFPVKSENGSLCKNDTTLPKSYRPLDPNLSQITTLGHTFTSDSVYLSFSTLQATWDGFWDPVGPAFKDLIVPFKSDEISTQCGGWFNARGPGTQLNYADLNWPVPAHAYSCQQRCTLSQTSSAQLIRPTNRIQWDINTVSPGPECDTIWSDVNPVIALPSKMKSFVPEWSTCSFWNDNLANFWFDPPKALRPVSVAAEPTMPIAPPTTPAAPSSTVRGPAAPSTMAMTTADPVTTVDPVVPNTSSAQNHQPVATSSSESSKFSLSSGSSPQGSSPDLPIDGTPHQSQTIDSASNAAAGALASNTMDPSEIAATVSLDPAGQSAPAFSILTEALSSGQGPANLDSAATASFGQVPEASEKAQNTEIAQSQSPVPMQATSGSEDTTLPVFSFDPTSEAAPIETAESSAAVSSTTLASYIAMGILTVPAAEQSESSEATVIDGQTLSRGGPAVIISGQTVVDGSPGLALVSGQKTVAFTAVPAQPVESTIAAGSVTLIAAPVASHSNAMMVDGETISAGGPVATISGNAISLGSDGFHLVGSQTADFTQLPAKSSLSDKNRVYALDSVTVTASAVSDHSGMYVIDGTTISQGGDAMLLSSATLTAGSSGLELVDSDIKETMSVVVSLPTMVTSSPSTTSSSASRSTATDDSRTEARPEATSTQSAAAAVVLWQSRSAILTLIASLFYSTFDL